MLLKIIAFSCSLAMSTAAIAASSPWLADWTSDELAEALRGQESEAALSAPHLSGSSREGREIKKGQESEAMSAEALAKGEALSVPHLSAGSAQRKQTLRIIIPTGGVEQNGPALALGKHHSIIKSTAEQIAKALPNTILAPIMDYVPEGNINPPEGHMQKAGTLSLRAETFAAVLEDTVRSLKQHRFTHIYMMGDHGSSQAPQEAVAKKLSAEWEEEHIIVASLSDYYAHNWENEAIAKMGIDEKNPPAHAGLLDSAELLAANEAMTRKHPALHTKATKALGEKMLTLKAQAAIKQIQQIEGK